MTDRYVDQFEDAADLAGALGDVEDVCREHGYDGTEPLDQWLRKLIAGIANEHLARARERDDARAEAGTYRALYERVQAELAALRERVIAERRAPDDSD